MVNGNATIILLTIGFTKKAQYKWVNSFLNQNLCCKCKSWIRFI